MWRPLIWNKQVLRVQSSSQAERENVYFFLLKSVFRKTLYLQNFLKYTVLNWNNSFEASICVVYRSFKLVIFHLFDKQVLKKRTDGARPFILRYRMYGQKYAFLVLQLKPQKSIAFDIPCWKFNIWPWHKALNCVLVLHFSLILIT